MRTLSDILSAGQTNQEPATEIERAIAAAYWAGQSAMRGSITEQVAQRLSSLPKSRYHKIARQAAEHVCLGVVGINSNFLDGRGDSGAEEAAEFLSWEFDL